MIRKATEKPYNYPICLNTECILRERCLHAIETTAEQMSATFITCVNPSVYADKDECTEFRDKDAIAYMAFGMQKIAKTLKQSGCYSAFIAECLHHFCRTVYYEMLAGEHSITPSDQSIILECAEKVGKPLPADSFDKMIEMKAW